MSPQLSSFSATVQLPFAEWTVREQIWGDANEKGQIRTSGPFAAIAPVS